MYLEFYHRYYILREGFNMPKTKFQEVIFTIIMVFVMAYVLVVYNIAIETGGLKYATFRQAILGMWPIYISAFLLEKFIVGRLAKKLAFRIVTPADKPIFIILTISSFTVCLMAPIMSMVATIIHNGFVIDIPVLWLTAFVRNFPMALCLQIFFVGPLVRLIFRNLFKNQLAK